MSPILLLASAAHATTYGTYACAHLGTNFTDAAVGYYFPIGTPVSARGARIKVTKYSKGFPSLLLGTVAEDYAAQSGTYMGCLPMSLALDSNYQYKMTVYSEAVVNGQTIEVYTDDSLTSLRAYTSASFYSPVSVGTWTVTTTGYYETWNTLAVASLTVWRNNLDNGPGTITMATVDSGDSENRDDCDGDATADDPCVAISAVGEEDEANYLDKYLIAHEVSHALLYQRYPDEGAVYNSGYGDCHGHVPETVDGTWFVSQEYQGAAFWEGFADYNAAAVLNLGGSTTGEYATYQPLDFDQDYDNEPTKQIIELNGGGSPTIEDGDDEDADPSPFTIDDTDYLDSCTSGTPNNNRGTAYDWLQFLWDQDVYEGMSPEEVAEVYVEARTIGGGYATSGNGTGAGYPGYELAAAADRLGLGDWGGLYGNAILYGCSR